MSPLSFQYWVKQSPSFVLEQSAWCARIIEDWTKCFGEATAEKMVRESEWVEPAHTLFATSWTERRRTEGVHPNAAGALIEKRRT